MRSYARRGWWAATWTDVPGVTLNLTIVCFSRRLNFRRGPNPIKNLGEHYGRYLRQPVCPLTFIRASFVNGFLGSLLA